MKKLFAMAVIVLSLICFFTSCDMLPQLQGKEDVITVDKDGYLVVNGVKTEYKVENENHTFSEWKLYNEGETDCEKKLYYRVCSDCSTLEWKEGKYDDHCWSIVTTYPTCQAGGYDTKTCKNCGKTDICNETPIADHDFNSEYLTDNSYHWNKCKNCTAISEKAEHDIDNGACTVCLLPISETSGIIYDFSADGTYVEVIDYKGSSPTVKIASEYQGLPVKGIYDNAFKNKTITNVIIPNSVISIGNSAFENCTNLQSITFSSNLTSIGKSAFKNCSQLKFLTIPYGVNIIGDSAFETCNAIASITIPDSVTRIGCCAFNGCSALEYIHIGSGVTSIGYGAFLNCENLKTASISDTDAWCRITFEYDIYDNSPEYNNTISPTYYTKALHLNGKIVTNIVIPNDVTEISPAMFINCEKLESITIPNSVTVIGFRAFYGCTSLTSVVIPDGVTDLSGNQFYGCSNLRSVTLGSNVRSVRDTTFAECNSALYTEYENGLYIGDAQNPFAIFYGVTQNNLSKYALHPDTKIIASGAFWECTRMTTLSIPTGVQSIGIAAFYKCTSLKSIVIPDTVTTICWAAFSDCTNLNSVIFENPNGWTSSYDMNSGDKTYISPDSIADSAIAAKYLTDNYRYSYWMR